jgi:hypothetical protein
MRDSVPYPELRRSPRCFCRGRTRENADENNANSAPTLAGWHTWQTRPESVTKEMPGLSPHSPDDALILVAGFAIQI